MEHLKRPLLQLDYYTPASVEEQSFIMMPAILYPIPPHKEDDDHDSNWKTPISLLSNDAKVLYSLMRSRMMSSAQEENRKHFVDNEGHIFIIMQINEISERMNLSKPKALRLIATLEDTGLIRVVRGKNSLTNKNLANKYYVMDVNSYRSNSHNTEGSQVTKCDPESQVTKCDLESQVTNHDPGNQVTNHDQSLRSNFGGKLVTNCDHSKNIRNIEKNRKEVAIEYLKKRVEYEKYIEAVYGFQPLNIAEELKVLSEMLIDEMSEIMISTKTYYTISGNRIPAEEMKSIVRLADNGWFSQVVSKMSQTPPRVKNGRAYTRAIIFNTKNESIDDLAGAAALVKYYLKDGGRT